MKRIVIGLLCIIGLFSVIMILSFADRGGEKTAIEDYNWKMQTVMSNNIEAAHSEDESVVVVGKSDELYPNAKIVDLTLVAEDGKITITDATNNKTYSGEYKEQQKTSKGTNYEVTINGVTGFATVSSTEYYDRADVPTLPVNLGEYSIFFVPNE